MCFPRPHSGRPVLVIDDETVRLFMDDEDVEVLLCIYTKSKLKAIPAKVEFIRTEDVTDIPVEVARDLREAMEDDDEWYAMLLANQQFARTNEVFA